MTLTVFRNLGKVMCGMSLDDLRMLPATSSLEGIVEHLTSLDCLSDKQVVSTYTFVKNTIPYAISVIAKFTYICIYFEGSPAWMKNQ